MHNDPFRRPPMVDFAHPAGQSLFWRISAALDRLVEQLENHSPVDLLFQKVDRDIAKAERAEQEAAMPRNDSYGDRGPKSDRPVGEPARIGSVMTINRLDGSTVDYRYTPAGWRMVPGSDTKANTKAEVERDLAALAAASREPDVKAHHSAGCGLCGRTDAHTHTQADWRQHIDGAGESTPPTSPPAAPKPPPPPRPSAAPSSGAGMSIEQVRAGILASNESANSGLGALQQAHTDLEQAQGALMAATEGSGQADVSEATGLLAQAVASVEEVRQQVSAAISAAESVANRL